MDGRHIEKTIVYMADASEDALSHKGRSPSNV